jgi:hypothetical protein
MRGVSTKVEDESAGAIADCDKNEVERADFDCFANAATENSEVNTGDGGDGGDNGGNGGGDQGDCPEGLVEINAEPLLCLVVAPETECEDVGLIEISAEPLICGEILSAPL